PFICQFRRPPRSPPFPYTTLFRSVRPGVCAKVRRAMFPLSLNVIVGGETVLPLMLRTGCPPGLHRLCSGRSSTPAPGAIPPVGRVLCRHRPHALARGTHGVVVWVSRPVGGGRASRPVHL